MGKKGKGGGGNLGKSLIKDRFGSRKNNKNRNEQSMLHTTEINDGYDWGRLNLQSVTEESSFQEFLSTAELAGTEFHAEKLNIKFVKSGIGLLSKVERDTLLESQEKNKDFLKIPRRPKWDSFTTADELKHREQEEFVEWRRQLAKLEVSQGLILTPYEKNLEFWRQLWRVVERSDVIVQIVDARNPLLFRCEDLECYVKEVGADKINMILVNKADFLTSEQREAWAKYFTEINLRVVFFSAKLAAEKIEEENEEEASIEDSFHTVEENESSDESVYKSDFDEESECQRMQNVIDIECARDDDFTVSNARVESDKQIEILEHTMETLKLSLTTVDSQNETTENTSVVNSVHETSEEVINSSALLNRDELVNLLKTIYSGRTYTSGVTTIGLVGYPNVGKSSTINALLMDKKVSVSTTPGKTKHFQTLYLDADLLLCDCPGLVMPSFICTDAEMILNGILPIDRMRDHVPAVTLLTTLIPRYIFEDLYGLMLLAPLEGEDPDRAPTAEELLNAYGYNRGFMTQNGQPDNPRSARYVLKDFVNGRLLYCVAPPTLEQKCFHTFPSRRRNLPTNRHVPPRAVRVNRGSHVTSDDLDRTFFQDKSSGVHVRGILGRQHAPQHSLSTRALPWEIDQIPSNCSVQQLLRTRLVKSLVHNNNDNYIEDAASTTEFAPLHDTKLWKKINKHTNKKKREKTRRLYAHLDQH